MPARSVLTLGNFDGPHLGHRAIVRRARELADAHGDRVVAITFDPPPVEVLRPGTQPPRLASRATRVAMLRGAGVDEVEIVTPTAELLSQSAERYVAQLVERYHPRHIVEGPDFRFGHGRGGDMQRLEALGQRHDFTAVTVPRVEATLGDLRVVPVSSSLVRWLVGHGRVADAAVCLGRPFSLTAPVVRGEQRGRKIDVPTANLDPAALGPYIIPTNGVYAGYATVEEAEVAEARKSAPMNQESHLPAAISIGVKPTFGTAALTVEAHLLDFDGDLYGRTLTLHFIRWLRDQSPFPGLEALCQQLQRDLRATRRCIASAPSAGSETTGSETR